MNKLSKFRVHVVFFKRTLQRITGENFPASFPNNTLREELALVEEEKSVLSFDDYIHWRKLTIDAYHAVYEVKCALMIATERRDIKDEWLRAYDKAQKADRAVTELLKLKLGGIPFQYYYNPGILYAAASIIFLFDFSKKITFITPSYELTENQLIGLAWGIFLLMLLLNVVPGVIFDKNKAKFATDLVGHHWCTKVLAEARKFEIEIDTEIDTVPLDQRWSNARLLADINCEEIPEEFNCPITHNPMDNPVHCSENETCFEKDEISKWLEQENTHPLTRKPMFWDDLIPNKQFKDEIDNFTHNEIRKFIDQTTMEPILEEIEMRVVPLKL